MTITAGFFAAASSVPNAGAASKAGAKSLSAKLTAKSVAAKGELDCNGDSPVQKALRQSSLCTDIRGLPGVDNANTWGGKFYDNGVYIGHDEPDMTFNSTVAGSGNNVSWVDTIGKDPTAAPTTTDPGHDVTHYFQLTPAPWFSMAMCDSNSYPQLPCTAESDSNAPSGLYPGGGSAFMEMQLYPPGEPPFVDSTSCDDSHWCAALTIDSLECTDQFAQCNPDCEEPVNFAFIQTNGVPTGPPSPQLADLDTETPNANTLLMNGGDTLKIHMWDALIPGGGGARAFKVTIDDVTTGQTGSMQASAANGFMNTSIVDCSGSPYNFQPEYSSALRQNIVPWAALQTDISTEFETGHFEGCSSVTDPFTLNIFGISDTAWSECVGGYEVPGGSEGAETSDALCYPAGDTHGVFDTQPDLATGCQDNYAQNGDLDFDGEPYYTDWPTGRQPTATWAGSFEQQRPTSAGAPYSSFFFQTDIALSESTCTASDLSGCTVPPNGPGHFYPYWSETNTGSDCLIAFGNVSARANDFGQDGEYGTNQFTTLGYPEFESQSYKNTCPAT
ncbi:MAG: hypothetical protein ACLQNG_12360 [Acidimicrobiales bacterium]